MELELFRGNVPNTQTPWASRDGILEMQEILTKVPGHVTVDNSETLFPLKHRFANGVYAREILLPEDTVVVGRIHRHAHLNVISKGHVSVLTEHGVEEYFAPCTFISGAGTKRVVYAHEDTIWTSFHGTRYTDVDQAVADIVCDSYEEFERLKLLEDKP